jgi:hypothetical protein
MELVSIRERARVYMPAVALGSLAAAAVLALALAACGRAPSAPATLVDGSRAPSPDVVLEGVDGPLVAVRTRVVRRHLGASPAAASCLRADWSEPPAAPAVHRVGTSGESVTLAGGSRRALLACDGTGARGAGRWCGHAFGRLGRGRLRDPRLDLGACLTPDRRPVAFAWIVPGPGTRYLVVRRRGFSESYATAAGLPVRIAFTERIDLERSRAAVEVSEHAADGKLLRTLEMEAVVSG